MDPVIGETDVTVEPTSRVRPAVPMRPNYLCLIVKEKVPLSAPPNIITKVLAASSTDTHLRYLMIVELAVLVA
jgi:hypothetical protein